MFTLQSVCLSLEQFWRKNGRVFQGAPDTVERCENSTSGSGISQQGMSLEDERTSGRCICRSGERVD